MRADLSPRTRHFRRRLQRIREISGHDLTDAGDNFSLQLATRAWRTLQALHTGPRGPGGVEQRRA